MDRQYFKITPKESTSVLEDTILCLFLDGNKQPAVSPFMGCPLQTQVEDMLFLHPENYIKEEMSEEEALDYRTSH